MKLVPFSLVLALALLAGSAASVGATTSRSGGGAGGFCQTARGVARDIVNSTSFGNGRVIRANVKTTYEKIAAAEPALLASASAPIKSNLRPVFGFVNLVIVDFRKVNWDASGLAPYAPALLARARTVQRPLHALRVYFDTTCKLDV